MILACTGHRPPRLGLSYDRASSLHLEELARLSLIDLMEELGQRPEQVLSGMAQGWDRAVAEAALSMGLSVTAALPFIGQESKWPAPAQASYHAFLLRCSRVVTVCEGPAANWKYAQRDRWLVEHSDRLLALYDGGNDGGTAITVHYAAKMGKPVHNVWPQYSPPG